MDAFKKGANNEAFQKLLSDRGYVSMNVSGDEANSFLKKWQSTTSWIVYDAGMGRSRRRIRHSEALMRFSSATAGSDTGRCRHSFCINPLI